MDAVNEIVKMLPDVESRKELDKIKNLICKKHGIATMLNSEILSRIPDPDQKTLQLLKTKPVRSSSGVTVVAVMTFPYECPGKCIYCPKGENAPQSYTGEEPAALRARMFDYDPYLQVKNRLKQLQAVGHTPQKIELIVMGGNFTSHPKDYQEDFIKRCLDAMNEADSETLEQAQELNEKSKIRCIGMTLECRPDWCNEEQINQMLKLGATRVELGVQTVYDDILKKVNRGHLIEDTIKATRLLKDAGFKVCYHMMPNLPEVDPEKDLACFKQIFENSDFKPDMLKIYPTLVIKGTKLYEMWKQGTYKTYSRDQLIDLLVEIKKIVPPWIRIMRIQRDIPIPLTEAGPDIGNIRELLFKKVNCQCIRCRQIKQISSKEKIKLIRRDYEANNGKEVFLSFEDDSKKLVGFLRLRIPNKSFRKEITEKTALVRELHVYGVQAKIGEQGDTQHRGYGAKLLQAAEKIAKDESCNKVIIISGVGVRPYYYSHNYSRDGPYVSKSI